MLVRIAALVAVDAPPVSYALNLDAAGEAGLDPERVRGVLAAIAPIVGTARVASATGNIVKALAVEMEIAELEEEEESRASPSPADRRAGVAADVAAPRNGWPATEEQVLHEHAQGRSGACMERAPERFPAGGVRGYAARRAPRRICLDRQDRGRFPESSIDPPSANLTRER